jgi:uncharacterized protein YcnI
MSYVRTSGRRLIATLIVAVLIGWMAVQPAAAHVRVTGEGAVAGGYGLLTFRVPTESDTASTIAVIIDVPTDTPIASMSVEPMTGWTAEVETEELAEPVPSDHGEITSAVRRIVWRADSRQDGIKPGEFARFTVSAGPLPEADSIAFPTAQRYSDGTTATWDEITDDPNAEPEHPAPVLTIDAAEASAPASTPAADEAADASADVGSATSWLLPLTTVLASLALVVAAIALLRTVRRTG